MDIYYSSVGRNSLLLLNCAPDKRGLIPEQDIRNVKKIKEIIDGTFKTNLPASAKIKTQYSTSMLFNLLVEDNKTCCIPVKDVTSATIKFDFGSEETFDVLMLKENFRNGQRVEDFVLDAFISGEWHERVKGTTIGYKRLLRFNPVNSRKVRLRILSSRDCTGIYSFGLYKSPAILNDK